MAENIEELKQTIDSVITSNGNGQITGQGLNIVLNDMCDVLGSTGGGGSIYICAGDSLEEYTDESGNIAHRPVVSNPENLALNKNAYDAITTGIQNKSIPLINISYLETMKVQAGVEDAYSEITNYSMVVFMLQGIMMTEEYVEAMVEFVENPSQYLNTVAYGCMVPSGSQLILLNDGKIIDMD